MGKICYNGGITISGGIFQCQEVKTFTNEKMDGRKQGV